MHLRNPYRTPLDFPTLAEFYPILKPFLKKTPNGDHVIDFRNSAAQREDDYSTLFPFRTVLDRNIYFRALTQALLKRDFGLNLDLPENRLCPPVPNRLNYVLWIQDIISSSAGEGEIRGLDIGTGASVIYPLLACSLPDNLHWSFIVTEIDTLSIKYATQNINANGLSSRITLYPVSPDSGSILAPLFTDLNLRFDFTICNPPFYGSAEEIERSAENKEFPPNAICTGAENEMITPGGEAEFVLKILRESSCDEIKNRCRWFTSMLGKLSTVESIVNELRNLKIDNYALTQFVQGTTRRWAIAWSFGDERLPDKYARPTSTSLVPFIPLPTTLRQQITTDPAQTKIFLSQILSSIEGLSFTFSEGNNTTDSETEITAQPDDAHNIQWGTTVTAFENTWSRAARRSRKRVHAQLEANSENVNINPEGGNRNIERHAPILNQNLSMTASGPSTSEQVRPMLVCRIDAGIPHRIGGKETLSSKSTLLTAQWVQGADRTVFEGFWSHVCRRLKSFEEQ